jgi:hypothetical protein
MTLYFLEQVVFYCQIAKRLMQALKQRTLELEKYLLNLRWPIPGLPQTGWAWPAS